MVRPVRWMKEKARRAKAFMMDYAYWMTLGAALVVIAASALYTRGLRQEQEIQAAAGAPEIVATQEPLPTPAPLATAAPFGFTGAVRPGGSTVRPVSGALIRESAPQTPVFWEALGCVQVHAGVDLAGEPGEDVRCAMDGTVREAVRDELWGWRVTVDQADGETALYAGLADSRMQAGEHVTRGTVLGALLDAIPCEAELGTHLHMELTRDGEAQDPMRILP